MQEEIMELIEMVIDQVERDEHITDHLFCAIEKDPDALKFYHELRAEYDPGVVNRNIGKILKKTFNLTNTKEGANATSGLISSYTLH